MVSLRINHHRRHCIIAPYRRSVHHRYATDDRPCNIYEQHALCLLVSFHKFLNSQLMTCRRILYKTRLPFILVFNKIDVEPHDFAIEWMHDFQAYQAALDEKGRDEMGEMAYSSSLMSSMSLVLDEFYNNLKVRLAKFPGWIDIDTDIGCRSERDDWTRDEGVLCGCRRGPPGIRNVSDTTPAVPGQLTLQLFSEYKPELARLAEERKVKAEAEKQEQLTKVMKDMNVSGSTRSQARNPRNPFGPHARNEREDR